MSENANSVYRQSPNVNKYYRPTLSSDFVPNIESWSESMLS